MYPLKPKVIILSAFLSPYRSGAEACVEEVALRLHERYDITIVTARLRRDLPKEDLLNGKVPIRRVGLGLGFDKWLYPFLAPMAVRRFKPDIIHAILETFAGLALHFCKYLVPSARRVLTLQTTNRSFLKGMIIRSPHDITAISSVLEEVALKIRSGRALGLEEERVRLIPNGIDLTNIEMRNPTSPRLRGASAKCEKVPGRVLFVGRLEKMKGVDTLLTAFAQILNLTHRTLQVHLRVVGGGSKRTGLEKLARSLGVADRVTFVGFVPHPKVYDEFAQAEIFCGLSRSEALGNVFLEALAAGCAVVGTKVGGIPDIIEDGKTGLLVPPDDVNAARGALGRVLRDESLRRSLVQKGREHAKQYDWGVIAQRYAEVYEQLLPPS